MAKVGRLDLLDINGNDKEDEYVEEEIDEVTGEVRRIVNKSPDDEDKGEFLDRDENPDLGDMDDSGTGLGTGTLISAINKLPSLRYDNIYDTIILNVATIIRNNTTKERSLKEIHDKTESDVHDLIRCVANYQSEMFVMLKEPMLMLYLPDYSWLPPLHMRPMTGNRKIVHDVTQMFIKEDNLIVRKRIRSHEGNTALLLFYAGGKISLPYKRFMGEIRDMYALGKVDPRSALTHYLLISHVPLDYHFMLKYPRTTLLESFTGNFIKPKALGKKVFGTNFIPFNSVTHLLFGDKVNVRPMAQRKNRVLLTDLAKKQSWYVRTPSEIARYVGNSGQVPENILTTLKL